MSALLLTALMAFAHADVAEASGPLGAGSEGAAPPLAHVTLAPDGTYDLLLQPPRGWEQAEITVSGDGAHDIGAVDADEPLYLSGVTSGRGEIWVVVQAVDSDEHGITWMFGVDPELVPLGSSPGERLKDSKRGFFSIFGGGGR